MTRRQEIQGLWGILVGTVLVVVRSVLVGSAHFQFRSVLVGTAEAWPTVGFTICFVAKVGVVEW